jgi:5-methylcytosine-specific restriction endonuclease McrA
VYRFVRPRKARKVSYKRLYPHYRPRNGNYPPNWEAWKKWAKQRAGHRYQICGRGGPIVELHTHHLVPVSKGGRTSAENIACLCDRCHTMQHPHMRKRYIKEHPWEFAYRKPGSAYYQAAQFPLQQNHLKRSRRR